MRAEVVRTARGWDPRRVIVPGLPLVARRHVDYVRVSSALCRSTS
ncbi:MAG: putative leader peptide [Pseudonocardiaceae bacterium]